MRMGLLKKYYLVFVLLLSGAVSVSTAKIINVPADYPTINGALQSAEEYDEIIIAPGTYITNLYIGATATRPPINVILRSSDPTNQTIVDTTIIQAKNPWACLTMHGTENSSTIVEGLTLKGGGATTQDYGGGVQGNNTHAIFRNNVIIGSRAKYGAGMSNCHGLIYNNRIMNNTSVYDGAGIFACYGPILNNTITGNKANGNSQSQGGGIFACTGDIFYNIIVGNSASYRGGGLNFCNGLLKSNIISNNTASGADGGSGGGLYDCSGTFQNNTVAYNFAKIQGGGMSACRGFIVNCIFWGNASPNGDQLYDYSTPYYSCIQNWFLGGKGNISDDPVFVDTANKNYHLQSSSPCINTGNTGYLVGDTFWDVDNECRLAGQSIDMGADEFNSSPDTDGDLLSNTDEIKYKCISTNPDTDADGLPDGKEVLRGLKPTAFNLPTGITVPTQVRDIQLAIFLSFVEEKIKVKQGVYNENLRFLGKNVIMESENYLNYQIVSNTIIDGAGAGSVMYFDGTETNTCVIKGLTIRNGFARDGGGIAGNGTGATFSHNRIIGNIATISGGGVYRCHGVVRNNLISNNYAYWWGGGVEESKAKIHNNIIVKNTAGTWGGGLYDCNGYLLNNTIAYNTAEGDAAADGGGIKGCKAVIDNCIIWGNSSTKTAQITSDCAVPSFSCIEGWGSDGIMNTSADPKFVDAANDDFYLGAGSSCIDKGWYGEEFYDGCFPPGQIKTRNDIGAYGGPDNCGWIHVSSKNLIDHILKRKPLPPEQRPYRDWNDDAIVDMGDVITLKNMKE